MMRFAARMVLLDIEGTVSPLAFVHEVMFPFSRERVGSFLENHGAEAAAISALERMALDAGAESLALWLPEPWPSSQNIEAVERQVHAWMDADAKLTGLKQLQGLIWEQGFKSGVLCAALFDDVAPVLREWHEAGVELQIYSSGSVHAQKLFFSHTTDGDLTALFAGYFDTTIGGKREASSYAAIAQAAELPTRDVLFLSDVQEELDAAKSAGMQTALAIRPGNRDTKDARHPLFHSLRDISIVCP